MNVQTENLDLFRNTHSKGLIVSNNAKYKKFKEQQQLRKRVDMIEEKLDKVLNLLMEIK